LGGGVLSHRLAPPSEAISFDGREETTGAFLSCARLRPQSDGAGKQSGEQVLAGLTMNVLAWTAEVLPRGH
jgi:hypothetical protein